MKMKVGKPWPGQDRKRKIRCILVMTMTSLCILAVREREE